MTLEQILAHVFPNLPTARRAEYAPLMEDAFAEFEITTKLRLAAVLGQLGVESRELSVWEENLNYSAKRLCQVWPKRFPTLAAAAPYANNPHKLALKVYNGRNGNRPNSEDGWTYRGRTPVQLTGRAMYAEVGAHLGLPLVDNPDLANDKAIAFRAVGCFFRDIKRILHLADQRQFKSVTIAVNGALTDWDARLQYYNRALLAIPDDFKIARSEPHTVPVLPDVLSSDVHEEVEEEEAAIAPDVGTDASAETTAETGTDAGADTGTETATAAATATATAELEPEDAQKVKQSWESRITAWWPMVSGPVAAVWLGIKTALDNPFVLGAIVLVLVIGFVVGAWLWNESKKRQAAQQQKLIDVAAAPDKHTVRVVPPPPKA